MDTFNNCCAKDVQPKRKNSKAFRMKELLVQEFPNCFKKGDAKQPLCIGIHIQVHAHYKDDARFEPSLIQQGLNKYCFSPKYIKKIITGTPRINIHGAPTNIVTAEEESYAKKKLQKMIRGGGWLLDIK